MADEPSAVQQPQAEPGAPAAPQTIEDFMSSRNTPAGTTPAQAARPESAPGAQPATPPQTPAQEPGPEPEGGGKAVKELIAQRQKRQEAEREAAYWRGVAEASRGAAPGGPAAPQPVAAPQGPPPRPVIEQFETYEQFEAARDRWMDDMVDYRAGRIREEVVRKTSVDTVHQTFVQRLEEAGKTNPAVADAYKTVGTAINQHMAQFIKQSPHGPQVLLYLHEHMDETTRLARTNPYLAIAELGQIAGKLAAVSTAAAQPAQPIQQSKAPPPVKPVVNNGAPVETPLDKMPIDDFMKERNDHQYGQRRR